MGQFSGTHLTNYWANFFQICRIYGGHNICNLIEIGPVVIEIRGVENGELMVPVNTLVRHTTFLASDT